VLFAEVVGECEQGILDPGVMGPPYQGDRGKTSAHGCDVLSRGPFAGHQHNWLGCKHFPPAWHSRRSVA